jgi:DNA-directed RNA polymerase sigma subunit (sigma70/sigma32)
MKPSRLERYLQEVAAIEPLHSWEEIALLARKEWDTTAHERLQRAYLHRVVVIAQSMCVDAPLLDVIQEGNVGLAMAVRKYHRGAFLPYLDHFIRRAIRRRFQAE